MQTAEIERILAAIDSETAPAAARFDSGEPLTGSVAVLPSAYNPPTLAHLHLLQRAAGLAHVAASAALLTTRNVAKEVTGAGLADRVAMLLALRSEAPRLAVFAANAARIIDQAHALRHAFPGAAFDFVMGYDTLVRLFDPRYYEDMPGELAPFFEHHRVIATNRAEAGVNEVERYIAESCAPFAARILVLEIEEHPASLSSTAARASAGTEAIRAVVPESVARYIESSNLYR